MIVVKDLYKKFGDTYALKGVNEHIRPGEKVVVIGPSGCGKSTFLRCLNLLEEPTSGEILFKGELVTSPRTDVNPVSYTHLDVYKRQSSNRRSDTPEP